MAGCADTIFRTEELQIQTIRNTLWQEIQRLLTDTPVSGGEDVQLHRIKIPVAPTNLFGWLKRQRAQDRIYWADRAGKRSIAALGTVYLVSSKADSGLEYLVKQIDGFWNHQPADVRLFGGVRFDLKRLPDDEWNAFGAYRFVVPRFELQNEAGRHFFICNLDLVRDRIHVQNLRDEVNRLVFGEDLISGELPEPVFRNDFPDQHQWYERIGQALQIFDTTVVEKIVLARKTVLGFESEPNPVVLFEKLNEATPGCFHFMFETAPGLVFMGASPERLFRLDHRLIKSEAVAGTRPRGTSVSDDARLRKELLDSDKEQREHSYVRKSIEENLRLICNEVESDAQASAMTLARGRHLYTGLRGSVSEGVGAIQILRTLHPTPAVGGYPTETSFGIIEELEPFDRGWYAGPVGWIGKNEVEFAVGLRSGLLTRNELFLYSGAGIVRGSTPESEWNEIELKIGDFIRLFGLDDRYSK